MSKAHRQSFATQHGLGCVLLVVTALGLGACTLLAKFPDFDAPDVCGDGLVGDSEQCDGENLGGQNCISAGYYPGNLHCDQCRFDVSECGGRCGDGASQYIWEECDGYDFGDNSCLNMAPGSQGGELICRTDCTVDVSQCDFCGDGVIDTDESCDGTNLDGRDCTHFGLGNGVLQCAACAWDLNQCGYCGDDVCSLSRGETTLSCSQDCRWSALAAAGTVTCGLRGSGTLYCWGEGPGSGPTTGYTPEIVDANLRFTSLAAGGEHFCALADTGDVYCWGSASRGQLGTGAYISYDQPTVVNLLGWSAIAVGVGHDHSCAVTSAGSLYCWGSNDDGCLGTGQDDNALFDTHTPLEVVHVVDARAVAGGAAHTCALTNTGDVWCWGRGARGQLGNGQGQPSTSAIAVSNVTDATALTAGEDFNCVIRAGGGVQCWGKNSEAQLADGTTLDALEPVDATALPVTVVDIDAGWQHVCATGTDTMAYCWGDGFRGRLGRDLVGHQCTEHPLAQAPEPVLKAIGVPSTDVVRVTAGRDHSCSLMSEGTAMCWGYAGDGQIGLGPIGPDCLSIAEVVSD